MALVAARLEVAPPVRTPLPYGLMSVAQTRDTTDPHWQLGIEFEPYTCSRADITFESCPASGGFDKTPRDVLGLSAANPFTVYTMAQCSTSGFVERSRELASAVLTAGEARAVEREFWTGENGLTPHLAENTAVTGGDGEAEQSAASVIVTGAVDVVEGVARIEEALGNCYGNEGVIHVPLSVLTHMQAHTLVTRDGPRLRTASGHLVAAGAGYPGTAPDGSAPADGVRWIYATGAVLLYRSAVTFVGTTTADVLNRTKNTVAQIAERTYVIGWDCCHFGLPINIGGVTSGVAGT
jgi:hypothetical protein